MNKNSKLLVAGSVILIILALGIGVYYWSVVRNASNQTSNANLNTQLNQSDLTKLAYNCDMGRSAFEALKRHFSKVDSRDTKSGVFVTSINGIEQGGGKYWIYSINGQDATVSADTYKCKSGDMVSWQLK